MKQLSSVTHLFLLGLLLLLSAMGSSVSAAGGGSVAGNGGDILYCQTPGQAPTLELLDLFELKLFRGLTPINLQKTSGNPINRVTVLFDDLAETSPLRAQLYKSALDHFFSRVHWVEVDLVDIPDSRHIVLPTNCMLRQIAIQDRTGPEPRYIIDSRLWNQLDPVQQTALILHEIIYGQALNAGAVNSIGTRKLVGYLASTKLRSAETNALETWNLMAAFIDSQLGQVLDLRLNDGNILLFTSALFLKAQWNQHHDPDQEYALDVIGFNLKGKYQYPENLNLINSPSSLEKTQFTVYIRGFRSFLGFDLQHSKLPPVKGEPLGLPSSVNAVHFPDWFRPSDSITIQNQFTDLKCRGVVRIEYESKVNVGDRWNFDAMKVLSCLLDPFYSHHIHVFGELRPVKNFYFWKKVPANFSDSQTLQTFSIEFSSPQEIPINQQPLRLKTLTKEWNRWTLTGEHLGEWNLGSYRCKLKNRALITWPLWMNVEFEEACLFSSENGVIPMSLGRFNPLTGAVEQAELAHPTKVHLDGNENEIQIEGKAEFNPETRVLVYGKLAQDATLRIHEWHNTDSSIRRLISRHLPAGIHFKMGIFGYELGQYNQVWLQKPFPIVLNTNSYNEDRGEYCFEKKERFVEFVDEVLLGKGGDLLEGKLAKSTTLPVLKVNLRNGEQIKEIIQTKIKQGTVIKKQSLRPGEYYFEIKGEPSY